MAAFHVLILASDRVPFVMTCARSTAEDLAAFARANGLRPVRLPTRGPFHIGTEDLDELKTWLINYWGGLASPLPSQENYLSLEAKLALVLIRAHFVVDSTHHSRRQVQFEKWYDEVVMHESCINIRDDWY